MSGLPYSVGEHPRQDPEPDRGPCAICKAKAAEALAGQALEMLTDDPDFPVHATREFLDAFGATFKEMAECLYTAAYTEAKRQDNEPCEMHARTKDDEDRDA